MSVFDAHEVLQALIHLNQWEDELKSLGPRTARRAELAGIIASERPKVAPFILAHHDRIRARGRCSTAPVREWICRSCFISVPIGLRTNLSHRNDLCVCENCGAYIYLPTPEQQAALEASDARKRQAVLARANKEAEVAAAVAPSRPKPAATPVKPAHPAAKKKAPAKKPAAVKRPVVKKKLPAKARPKAKTPAPAKKKAPAKKRKR